MTITPEFLDQLTEQAKASPRLRMNYDMRTPSGEPGVQSRDTSQRMLNALEPGTEVPIHRHPATSETVVMLRGRGVQYFYNDRGEVEEAVVMESPMAGDGSLRTSPAPETVKTSPASETVKYSPAPETVKTSPASETVKTSPAPEAVKTSPIAKSGTIAEPGVPALGGPCQIMSVEAGRWHRLVSLESGTVIFECKDGTFEPRRDEDVLIL